MASVHNELIPACCADCLTVEETMGRVLLHQKAAHHTKCPMCPQRFECFEILMRHYIETHISQTTGFNLCPAFSRVLSFLPDCCLTLVSTTALHMA
ncbi:hypothetical protein TcWFU_003052 [Taenia crassiceps]|uniref:C2H2-type domain-containing protein n=1 Tax=Taenia crassiceps TaxID=6207 RepID=A0ABR4Q2F6_9CEST